MIDDICKTYMELYWDGKPYYSLNAWLKQQFGKKAYKLALDAGMGCPNRDGKIGYGGCIFCSEGGSGDFATKNTIEGINCGIQITEQIEKAKMLVSKKIPVSGPYIAYFQSYTNTYASANKLESLFTKAIMLPEIAALSIATRPDCLEPEKISLLSRLNAIKPVWVELGLQTIHPKTADFIRRGYPLSCFEEAVKRLKDAGLTIIVHLILGIPGETERQMLQSVDYIAHLFPSVDGIKLQLLHVLKGTDLCTLYKDNPFPLFSKEAYVDFAITCLEHLPPTMVIHRLTGDGPKKLLVAPEWSADKKQVLNAFTKRFHKREAWQGRLFLK